MPPDLATGSIGQPMIDWNDIESVFLDLDGTLLDLRFDNHFWVEFIPEHYAQHHQLAPGKARADVLARMKELRGTLDWYCTDFWSRELNLDIIAFINWNEDAIVAAFVSKEDGGFAEAWTARVERWGLAHANGSAYRPATDIVMATDQTLEWLTAEGLTPAHTLTQMNTIGSIFGDFNGDGTLDIIGHSIQNRGEAAGLAGDGQGGFTPTDTQLNLQYGEQVRDLDQDGLDDVYRWLWAGGNNYDLDILRNTSVD